uniref:Uncharacterized protein n=1 Tax=Leersia perrieri TaxID=77586 RepID=A0A0D9XBL9_9ORYZ
MGTPSLAWSSVVVVVSLLAGASIVHNIYKPDMQSKTPILSGMLGRNGMSNLMHQSIGRTYLEYILTTVVGLLSVKGSIGEGTPRKGVFGLRGTLERWQTGGGQRQAAAPPRNHGVGRGWWAWSAAGKLAANQLGWAGQQAAAGGRERCSEAAAVPLATEGGEKRVGAKEKGRGADLGEVVGGRRHWRGSLEEDAAAGGSRGPSGPNPFACVRGLAVSVQGDASTRLGDKSNGSVLTLSLPLVVSSGSCALLIS